MEAGASRRCVWAINMSCGRAAAEGRIKSVVLCLMVGLLMGLAVTTVLEYGQPVQGFSHAAWHPNDRLIERDGTVEDRTR